MKKTLEQLRKETPGCLKRIHFNNAGTALSPQPVVDVVNDYLRLEQEVGGYEAEALKSKELDRVYESLARLLGCSPQEVAITQNATRAWDMLFYAVALEPGDKILTCRSEYASNYIAFLQRCRATGAEIVVLDNDDSGAVSPKSLAANLDDRVKLVAINHIPTNSGLIQPAEELGAILREHPAFYLLDACQSAGQIPLDVARIGCDALTATSRKYLRGPRGIGFLYCSSDWLPKLEPPFLDLHAATWTEPDNYTVRQDARKFETYELFVGGKLGLGRDAEYALEVGQQESSERLMRLAALAREGLQSLPGVTVCDIGRKRGGIVTFTVEGWEPTALRQALFEREINIWTCTVRSARLDMEARGLEEVCRASLHYYNTEDEIEEFLVTLRGLAR